MENILTSFFKGSAYKAHEYFGAHPLNNGYVFRVFAPNAKKVYLVGNFNSWDTSSKMNKIDDRGVYEIFTNKISKDYELYKYLIITKDDKTLYKADPYAFYSELRPNTASITYDLSTYEFKDERWMNLRNKCDNRPLSIYEIHLGSFIKNSDNSWKTYEELAEKLISYVKKANFTHVEFLPLMEHPYDGSWGYQCSQYFSITSRYGNPSQLKRLIDKLHQNNIGVIIDFVPVHFVKDESSLANFDGQAVYEADDESLKKSQWDTYLFDFTKEAVRSYLTSCVYFYLSEYHFDGIRFDAISNMIYKDGNSNNKVQVANINWLKNTNELISRLFPKVMLIAEDSSTYPKVTGKIEEGGLGFDYKWDLGWMNDTLSYLRIDPLFRGDHLKLINFSMYYFYSERFLLPLSHDEVVHEKGTIINKIWGTYEQKFEQLKVLYTYMFTHPGKKLNFMGNELALFEEWNENKGLRFDVLNQQTHKDFNAYFTSLNKLYKSESALYMDEYDVKSFNWLSCDNKNNVFIYKRNYKSNTILVVLNFSTIKYDNYLIKVSEEKGCYEELLNSDSISFNGTNYVNNKEIRIDENQNIGIKIPQFGALVLKYKNKQEK